MAIIYPVCPLRLRGYRDPRFPLWLPSDSVSYNGTSEWALPSPPRPLWTLRTWQAAIPCCDRALSSPSAVVVGFRALLPRGLLVFACSHKGASVPPFPVPCLRFGLRSLRLFTALVALLLWWAVTPCLVRVPPPFQAFLSVFRSSTRLFLFHCRRFPERSVLVVSPSTGLACLVGFLCY